jgi:nitroreductase
MKNRLRKIKRTAVAVFANLRVRREAAKAFRYDKAQFMANAGALHLDRRAAARAEIVMGYHVIEKGLTMPRRRLGFGKGAIIHLINLIESYERSFCGVDGLKADPQVAHAVGVLRAYRELHHDWPEPMPRLDAFLASRPDVPAAREPHVTRAEFFAAKDEPFPVFAASRHVCRHFAGSVPRETVEKAVAIATTAPSACNRQHARVHVVDDPGLRDKLFAIQGGTRGFGADADKVLVVTADLSAVRWGWERHDCYVNGGIFVMNLCYALHYLGVAHCILHWSVPPESDRAAHVLLGIPFNEAIVQVVACGMPPEEFDVAASPRLAASDILAWHGGSK